MENRHARTTAARLVYGKLREDILRGALPSLRLRVPHRGVLAFGGATTTGAS